HILLFSCYGPLRVPHSFPTRRSSDLDRRLVATPIQLPDSGTRSVNLSLPTARILPNGWSALDVRLEGVDDMEPRDDARSFVVEVDRKSTRLNSSHGSISYAVFCLKKK